MLNYKYEEKGKEKKAHHWGVVLFTFLFTFYFKSVFRNRSFDHMFTQNSPHPDLNFWTAEKLLILKLIIKSSSHEKKIKREGEVILQCPVRNH